jgi:hypothetical protein
MNVPVCFEHKHEVLRMGVAGAVKFPNPKFVAALLRTGPASAPGGARSTGGSRRQTRQMRRYALIAGEPVRR